MIAITRGIMPMNIVLRMVSRNGGSIAVRIFKTVNKTMRIRENGIRARNAIFLTSKSIFSAHKEDSPEVQILIRARIAATHSFSPQYLVI